MALGDIRIKTGSSYSGQVTLSDLGGVSIAGANVDILISSMFDVDAIGISDSLGSALTGGTGANDLWVEDSMKSATNPRKITNSAQLRTLGYGLDINPSGLGFNTSGALEVAENLQDIGALTPTANKLLSTDANNNIVFGNPGSETGTQAYNAFLQSISGLGTGANKMLYVTGSDTAAETDLTAFARTLLGDSTAAGMRSTLDVYSTNQVDNLIAGLSWKDSVRVATKDPINTETSKSWTPSGSSEGKTMSCTTNGVISIDGVELELGDRVLLMGDGVHNGIYDVTTVGTASSECVLTRSPDADNTPAGELDNLAVFVNDGTTYAATAWTLTNTAPIDIDTEVLTFAQFGAGAVTTASNGLKKVANDYQLDIHSLTSILTSPAAGSYLGLTDPGDADNTKRILFSDFEAGLTLSNLGGELDLASQVDGTLPVTSGGTGATTHTAGGLLVGSGAAAVSTLSGTANGHMLIWNNSTNRWVPALLGGTTNRLTVANAAGGITLDIASNYVGQNTITTLGTIGTGVWEATAISATKGGTGQTAYTKGDILYSSDTDTLSRLGIGTPGQVLTVSQGGVVSWNTVSGTIGNGTTDNSTLRWDGSGWVENTAILSDGNTDTSISVLADGVDIRSTDNALISIGNSDINSDGTRAIIIDSSHVNIVASYDVVTGTSFSVDADGALLTSTDANSIALDINATTAIRLPSGTTAERPTPASAGMNRFNTDTNKMEFHDGTTWVDVIDTTNRVYTFSAGTLRNTVLPRFLEGPGGATTNEAPYVVPENGFLKSNSVYLSGGNNSTFTVSVYKNGTIVPELDVVYSSETGAKTTSLATGDGVPVNTNDIISIKIESVTGEISKVTAHISVATLDH